MQQTRGHRSRTSTTPTGDVFDLDPFVGERSGVGEDLDGRPNVATEQVDGVRA
jgi:hypothetical protein